MEWEISGEYYVVLIKLLSKNVHSSLSYSIETKRSTSNENVEDLEKYYNQKNITSSSVVEVALVLLMLPLFCVVGVLDCFDSGLRMRNFSGNFG